MLALAHEQRVPVTPFGAGSSLEGHVIPVAGGISLDLTRMDRILDVSPADLTATVQAGVTRGALERAVGRARAAVSRRSGRRCDARRHGGDQRRRNDDGALREDARERSRRRGRAPGRHDRPRGEPRAEDVRRLRPPRPARRLGGDTGRDHRADRSPAGDPGARRRPPALVPRRRVGMPGRDDDRRRRSGRDAGRAPRRMDDRARSMRTRGRTSRPVPRCSSRRPGPRAR